MPRERNAFKLGLALIAFFVLFIAVMVFLTPRGGDLSLMVRYPHDELYTVLKRGGEVACGGKVVGSIRSIELKEMPDPSEASKRLYVLVGVEVDSALGLRRDCRIVPEELLLGGPGKLVIAERGVGEPVGPGDVVEGQAGASVAGLSRMLATQLDAHSPDSMVTKLRSVLDHVNDIACLLRHEVDGQSKQPLMARLHESLDRLDDGLATATAMLKENREPIAATVGHVRATSEVLEQQIAVRIAGQLDPSQQASLMAKVHVTLDRLGDSVRDLNTITSHTRELVVMNKEQLNRTLANFKETSDQLKAASKEIRRSPWRLFYQPTMAEAEQANVMDAARAFAEAATRLDDAVARLDALSQAATATRPAGDEQLDLIRRQLQETFNKFSKAEAALWEGLKVK